MGKGNKVEAACGQTSHCMLTSVFCFVYDFQTLLTGLLAIVVAVIAGIPVWRQLRDTNLQTRISHRETLVALLRDALRRYEKVNQSLSNPLSTASRATTDFDGEPIAIDPHGAHHLYQLFHGVLDWYLVVLADTEHNSIESCKTDLKLALGKLTDTLHDAHWADANEQHGEDYQIPDDKWKEIITRCAQAKIEAAERVSEVNAVYRALREAHEGWAQSLRAQIAKLDLQIVSPA